MGGWFSLYYSVISMKPDSTVLTRVSSSDIFCHDHSRPLSQYPIDDGTKSFLNGCCELINKRNHLHRSDP